MSNDPIEIQLSEVAAQHAKELNSFNDFTSKWNSEHGRFFTTMLTSDLQLNASDTASILYELGLHSKDSGFNFSVAAHLLAGVIPIVKHFNSPEVINAVNAGAVCANAMTESGSGSDSFKMSTIATRSGNELSLSGSKTFITNGPIADYFVVYAMTDSSKGFFGGVSCFLLDKVVNRFDVGSPIQKSSLKNSPMSELFFENCLVKEEFMIGKEGSGAMIFLQSMDWERSCMAAMHAGTMMRLSTETAAYAKNRVRGGKALSEFQAVQFKIADMAVAAEASRLMAIRAAALLDLGRGTVAAAQAKILASESLMQVASLAATVHGGNGITDETGLAKAIADAQAAMIYSGPNDVLRELIAGHL